MVEKIKHFINTYDFDMLFNWLNTLDPITLLFNPYFIVPVVIILALVAYPKTSYLGQQLVLYVPAGLYIFVTVVILRNDSITEIGPFIMAMAAFFMIVGWLIWTKLLKD